MNPSEQRKRRYSYGNFLVNVTNNEKINKDANSGVPNCNFRRKFSFLRIPPTLATLPEVNTGSLESDVPPPTASTSNQQRLPESPTTGSNPDSVNAKMSLDSDDVEDSAGAKSPNVKTIGHHHHHDCTTKTVNGRPGGSHRERLNTAEDPEYEDTEIDAGIDVDPFHSDDMVVPGDRASVISSSTTNRRRQPESCSSFSSLNNDEGSGSLYSQEAGVFSHHQIDPRLTSGSSGDRQPIDTLMGSSRPVNSYQRKYSLAVPGEPRYIHRQNSGSRSPLNCSYGGLSPSELSTPSPSCSNSINDDQSSYSSGNLHEIIPTKCALSMDSLFLKSPHLTGGGGGGETKKLHHDDRKMVDELCKNFIELKTGNSGDNNDGDDDDDGDDDGTPDDMLLSPKSALKSILKSGHSEDPIAGTGSDMISNSEVIRGQSSMELGSGATGGVGGQTRGKRRKNSMTAMIASLILPESICQRIGASLSTDRLPEHSPPPPYGSGGSESSSAPSRARKFSTGGIFFSSRNKSSTSDQLSNVNIQQPPEMKERQRRKGSIAQITSASATRIVRLLRRTHSAGCSKDVPSYALFLGATGSGDGKHSHHHHHKQRKYNSGSSNNKSSIRQKKQRLKKEKQRNSRILAATTQSSNNDDDGGQQPSQNHQPTGLDDVRSRLRFLSRRHTDSSLHSSTVRPSKEELEKWSKSFRDLMANRYGSALFRAFLCREFSDENIEFWLACEEYRKIRSSKLRHKARKIYENYVAIRSPREVNLDPKLREEIYRNLSAPSKFTFDEAQRKIQSLLESDSYVRFLQSDLYTDLVMSELKRQQEEEERKSQRAASSRRQSNESQTSSHH